MVGSRAGYSVASAPGAFRLTLLTASSAALREEYPSPESAMMLPF
jgi:hypothetical protein